MQNEKIRELFLAADAAWQAMWPFRGFTNTAVVITCERLRKAVTELRPFMEQLPDSEEELKPSKAKFKLTK